MRWLAKNFILMTAVVSAIFFVDPTSVGAASLHQIRLIDTFGTAYQHLDFWSKFRDTVMPDPDKPQDNNPPKEMRKPKPKPVPPRKDKPAN